MNKTKGLNLNILGTNGSGQFGVIPLRVQADNGTYLPHETSWNSTISDNILINVTQSNNVSINFRDYSSNYYDYFYSLNRGQNYMSYNLDSSWYVDMVDSLDDIAVVGTREWTSTEKFSQTPNTYADPATLPKSFFMGKYYFTPNLIDKSLVSYQFTCGSLYVDSSNGGVIIAFPGAGVGVTVNYPIPQGQSLVTINLGCWLPSQAPTIAGFYGYGAFGPTNPQIITQPSVGCGECSIYDKVEAGTFDNIQTIATNKYINGTYAGYDKNKYYFSACSTSGSNTYVTPICITNSYVDTIHNQPFRFLKVDYQDTYTPIVEEILDFSDIFLEVTYQPDITGIVSSVQYAGIPSGQHVISYKFGGFYEDTDFVNKYVKTYDKIPEENKNKLFDEDGYTYFFVRKKAYDIVWSQTQPPQIAEFFNYDMYLSSYIIPTGQSNNIDFTSLYGNITYGRNKYNVSAAAIIPYDSAYISPAETGIRNGILSTKSIKYVNFPNCGKVDIYTKKTGSITAVTNNTITSSGHGLITGDQIKITCGLGSSSGISDINGFRYISGVNTDSFKVYFDSNLQTPANISGLKTVSGVSWVATSPTNWNYKHTVYSPNGKNGYGYYPSLRTVSETGVNGKDMFARAIETSSQESGITRPQFYLDGKVSWNNFYPFNRIGTDQSTSEAVVNGNKFGSDCRIKKLSDNQYLLIVGEPGAETSFKIFDDYIVQQQLNKNPQLNLPTPINKYVIPPYLPYGRVHFYKITKEPYSIEYLTSTSAPNNPWAAYESANLQYKRSGYTTTNYTIDLPTVKNIYNNTSNNYWLGARYYSWNKNYLYNPTYGLNLPDQNSYPNEFGFVDSFGKSVDMEIVGYSGYCAATTTVKSAGFTTASRLTNLDAVFNTFTYNTTGNVCANFTGIVSQTPYISASEQSQIDELSQYGNNICVNNGTIAVGWPAESRGQEYIYLYNRSGITYTLKQTLTSPGNNEFGNYFVINNDYLVTNAKSKVDDSGNTTIPLSYLNVFKSDYRTGNYNYIQRISPTVDLGKSTYDGLSSEYYVDTSNLSYDNTSDSSVTLTVDLYGKYDLYNNSLLLRDYNEYAYFVFDGDSRKFKCKTHSKISDNNLLTSFAIVKLAPGTSSTANPNSHGGFTQSLNVLEGSEYSIYSRILSTEYQKLNFLPLTVKTIDGITENSGLYFRVRGAAIYDPRPTGINLYTQGPIPVNTGITLVAKQPDVYASGMNLFMKEYDISDSSINLMIRNQKADKSLTLIVNPRFNNYFPITIKTFTNFKMDENGQIVETDETPIILTTQDNFESLSLFMDNHYTGVPNSSGNFNLYLKTRPYDDYGQAANLTINYPFPESSGSLNLVMNNFSGSSFTQMPLFVYGPDIYSGTEFTGILNLFIHRIIEAAMPLTVYNTYSSGGLDTFVRGAYLSTSGINLYTSGEVYPTEFNNNQTLYVRGTVL